MRLLLALLLLACPLGAQQVRVTPDSLVLILGDSARPLNTVTAIGGAEVSSPVLTYSSSVAGIITARTNGMVVARALGCTFHRVSFGTYVRAQRKVCVVPRVVVPPPDTTPPPPVDTTTPPPSSGGVLFATAWDAGTRTDGGRLNQDLPYSSTILAVVPKIAGLPASWPANLLRITFAARDAQLVGAVGQWAAPMAGAKVCFRFLTYNALPNGSGVAFEHGAQSNIGDLHHFWQFFSPESTGSGWLGFGGSGAGGNNFALIPARRPLRVEECYTRTTGTRARVELRVTDESTGQVWTNTHFGSNWGESPSTLVGREMTFATEMDGFRSYYFGASGSSGGSGVSVYVTAFAVCTDWCGPYRVGEGR